jgi:hypothetical protein
MNRPGFPRVGTVLALAIGFSGLLACDNEATEPEEAQTFTIEVSGEQFKVRVTDPQDILALEQRMTAAQTGVISGKLVAGDGGFNSPWSWHLDPGSVQVPDVSTEVCDGRPSFVEADLQYWLNNVVFYCPWGARVVANED